MLENDQETRDVVWIHFFDIFLFVVGSFLFIETSTRYLDHDDRNHGKLVFWSVAQRPSHFRDYKFDSRIQKARMDEKDKRLR